MREWTGVSIRVIDITIELAGTLRGDATLKLPGANALFFPLFNSLIFIIVRFNRFVYAT
jgi:hypothetical protein